MKELTMVLIWALVFFVAFALPSCASKPEPVFYEDCSEVTTCWIETTYTREA